MPAHMELTASPVKKGTHEIGSTSPGSKLVGPGPAETIHASEYFEKTGLVAAHLAALHDAHMLEMGLLPGTSLADSEAPSIPPVLPGVPWKGLKPISFKEMKVGKTHRRHVLEGRFCVKSLKIHSVVNVLEEDSGLAAKITLTNAVPMRASMTQAQHCYPEGARVAVRDPYLKRFPDGMVGVLVENPDDIVFLSMPEMDWERRPSDHESNAGKETFVSGVGASTPEALHSNGDISQSMSEKPKGEESKDVSSQTAEKDAEETSEAGESDVSRETVAGVSEGGKLSEASSSAPSKVEQNKDSSSILAGVGEDMQMEEVAESLGAEHPLEVSSQDSSKDIEKKDSHGSEEGLQKDATTESSDVQITLAELEEEANDCSRDLEVEQTSNSVMSTTDGKTPQVLTSLQPTSPTAEEHLKLIESSPSLDACGVEDIERSSNGKRPQSDSRQSNLQELTQPLEEVHDDSGGLSSLSAGGEDTEDFTRGSDVDMLLQAKTPPEARSSAAKEQLQEIDLSDCVAVSNDEKPVQRGTLAGSFDGESQQEARLVEQSPVENRIGEQILSGNFDHLSSKALRIQGNNKFSQGDFQGAVELYSRGILQAKWEQEHRSPADDLAKPSKGIEPIEDDAQANGHAAECEVLLGYSNRAEAWIRLHLYENALADGDSALALESNHLKSLFRKGRALLGLGQYQEALEILQAAAPRAPSDKDLQAALQESIVGVQQSQHGVFDLSHFYSRGRFVGEIPSYAEFVGSVKIEECSGHGRGLILTKDVEAGDLLLVANPMAFTQFKPTSSGSEQIADESCKEVASRLLHEALGVLGDRDFQKLSSMFHGNGPLPASLISISALGRNGTPVTQLDTEHICRIIQLNAINGNTTLGWRNWRDSGEKENKVESWGLWWLPSFINHSCLPNSSLMLVGRNLFVFASRDLRAGEEITRNYFNIFQPQEQRRELSTKGWGFVCDCTRCKLEESLESPPSQVTSRYIKLMELVGKSQSQNGSDPNARETQAALGPKFYQELDKRLKGLGLKSLEESWVRASFLQSCTPYPNTTINSNHELNPFLELAVEAMVAVCPGSKSTLRMGVVAKEAARRAGSKKSVQFKSANQRAMHICRCTYGKQKTSVLQALVDAEMSH